MDRNDFVQGTAHDVAVKAGKLFSDFTGPVDMRMSIYRHSMNLFRRVDYKGWVTDEEAREHWRNGGGEPLFIDLSMVDVSSINVEKHFKDKNEIFHDFFLSGGGNSVTRKVYGTNFLTESQSEVCV